MDTQIKMEKNLDDFEPIKRKVDEQPTGKLIESKLPTHIEEQKEASVFGANS